jgi:hypothetical protein
MEVCQGPNWGCSAKEKKIISNQKLCRLDLDLNKTSSLGYMMHIEHDLRCIRMRARFSRFWLILHPSKR